jgi:uncharacterized membrane protein (DUF485 family)
MADNVTESVDLDKAKWDTLIYFTMAVICLLFLVIVIGNTLTIVAFVKFHSLRKVRNYFLVSLAVGDIFYGMDGMAYLTVLGLPVDFWANPCKNAGFSVAPAIGFIVTVLSYLHVLVITVDCFVSIIKPLHYHQLMTPSRAKIIIGLIWTLSVLFGSVYLIDGVFIDACKFTEYLLRFHTLLKTLLWACVVMAVGAIYVKILLVVRRQKRRMVALRAHQQTDAGDSSRNKRLAMVFMIVMSFILLWLPYITVWMLTAFFNDILADGMSPSALLALHIICSTIAIANSAVNTFIYARMDKEFRKAYKLILQCKWNQPITS